MGNSGLEGTLDRTKLLCQKASQGMESEYNAGWGAERVKVTSSFRKDFLEKVSFELGLEGMVGLLCRNRGKKGAFGLNRERLKELPGGGIIQGTQGEP